MANQPNSYKWPLIIALILHVVVFSLLFSHLKMSSPLALASGNQAAIIHASLMNSLAFKENTKTLKQPKHSIEKQKDKLQKILAAIRSLIAVNNSLSIGLLLSNRSHISKQMVVKSASIFAFSCKLKLPCLNIACASAKECEA